MGPKLVELRPNQSHLDPNFNGYKLSLEKLPIIKEALHVSVDHVLPSNDQYSFLHAKLFGLHNHLTGDVFNDNDCVYFVDKNQCVQKASLDEFGGSIILTKVWEVPEFKEHRDGDYNFSLKFANKNLAVISNGAGMLYIIETGSRNGSSTWQCVFCDEVIGSEKQFIIQDVVYNEDKLHCLLFSVEQDTSTKKCTAGLHWVTLVQADNDKSWGAVALRELSSKGDLYYAYFEPNCNAIYAVSDNGCRFTVDSENPIKDEPQSDAANSKYKWSQTYEDITLKFELPKEYKKDDINIKIDFNEIDVSYEDVLLKGKLTHRINKDTTTWTVTNNILEINLNKAENGVMWSEVVEGDQTGQLSVDPNIVEEAHHKLGHLCNENEITETQDEQGPIFSRQQIEECDFEDDKLAFFERLDCVSHEVTHRANLGSHHVLLTVKLSEDLPPAMAIRYDVDACLWQPIGSNDNFSLNHEATLLAFGYVQASKQQKKFCSCAPDLNYSVICESTRHVFIYRQNKPIGNAELRNRTTGKRFGTIAQQQVVNVSEDEILGIFAANNVLFLLTENSILVLKL
ncbi:hypothetical protein ILUMI_02875 [Ignelater luminosus]|uniref:NudC domain-containing protein 1 n=1 Tax=Ignelater luminosus TaxID=2038154 RepID=A0A8K0DFP5_IGNLU|nr:hypothetical protein ILUMI_02875 [Ignelater luminosus]